MCLGETGGACLPPCGIGQPSHHCFVLAPSPLFLPLAFPGARGRSHPPAVEYDAKRLRMMTNPASRVLRRQRRQSRRAERHGNQSLNGTAKPRLLLIFGGCRLCQQPLTRSVYTKRRLMGWTRLHITDSEESYWEIIGTLVGPKRRQNYE